MSPQGVGTRARAVDIREHENREIQAILIYCEDITQFLTRRVLFFIYPFLLFDISFCLTYG